MAVVLKGRPTSEIARDYGDEAIVALLKQLTEAGHDAGAETIA